jgi:hypothetical protein
VVLEPFQGAHFAPRSFFGPLEEGTLYQLTIDRCPQPLVFMRPNGGLRVIDMVLPISQQRMFVDREMSSYGG